VCEHHKVVQLPQFHTLLLFYKKNLSLSLYLSIGLLASWEGYYT
jgi:hypothetical protein